jgi:hypothetical protein
MVKNLIALLLSVLFCLILLFSFFAYRAYRNPLLKVDEHIEGDLIIESDREIGFVSVKNGASRKSYPKRGVMFHEYTDSVGARVNSSSARTSEKVDILFVGGSYTWGQGVENEQTFAQLIGKMRSYEVANVALPSYGTVQSLLMMKRKGTLRPGYIVYGFMSDHIRRSLSPCAPTHSPYCLPVPYVDFDDAGAPYINPPLDDAFTLEDYRKYYEAVLENDTFDFQDVLWQMRIDMNRFKQVSAIPFANDMNARRKSMNFLIREMQRYADDINAKMIVVYIPNLNAFMKKDPPPQELLGSLNENIIFVDMTPHVIKHYAAGGGYLDLTRKDWSLADLHPGEFGHRLIADVVVKAIERHEEHDAGHSTGEAGKK